MYKVTFEDNSIFIGGTPENSKWSQIEDKSIQMIEYVIGNRRLIMQGYDKYNHLIEYTLFSNNENRLTKIILLGANGEDVTSIIFNIKKHSIERQSAKLGYEYNGRPANGWKKGIIENIGKFSLLEN